jgi:choline dehydrogenase-like flavoprotein
VIRRASTVTGFAHLVMEDSLFDVIVIGAGVVGSATAYAASKGGAHVLLLEQFDLLHRAWHGGAAVALVAEVCCCRRPRGVARRVAHHASHIRGAALCRHDDECVRDVGRSGARVGVEAGASWQLPVVTADRGRGRGSISDLCCGGSMGIMALCPLRAVHENWRPRHWRRVEPGHARYPRAVREECGGSGRAFARRSSLCVFACRGAE